jgi:hypothetical protein
LRRTLPFETEATTAAFPPRRRGDVTGVMVTDITPDAAAACAAGVSTTPPTLSAITAPDMANLLLSIWDSSMVTASARRRWGVVDG